MKKRFLLIFSIFLVFSTFLFCQEEKDENSVEIQINSKKIDFFIQLEPTVYLNPEASKLKSAPSPIIFPLTLGIKFPNYTLFSFSPSISFFMMNHLLFEGIPLPAEIENRTSTTFSFMLNLPCSVNFLMKNFELSVLVGIGIFARFSALAHGINENDSGFLNSAIDDVNEMNSFFWKNGNWFYLTAGFCSVYKFSSKIKFGPTMNIYLPIIPLIKEKSTQAMMISFGVKIVF